MRHRLHLGDETRSRVLPESPAVCPCAACRRHTALAEAADCQAAVRREQARAAERRQDAAADAADVAARHDAIDADLGPVLHARIVAAAVAANPILKFRQLSAVRVRRLAALVYADHAHDLAAIRAYAQGLPPGPQETDPDSLPRTTAPQPALSATDSTSPTPTPMGGGPVPSVAALEAAIAARIGAA